MFENMKQQLLISNPTTLSDFAKRRENTLTTISEICSFNGETCEVMYCNFDLLLCAELSHDQVKALQSSLERLSWFCEDSKSRQAVRQHLTKLVKNEATEQGLHVFVRSLCNESNRESLSATYALVLIDCFNILFQEICEIEPLWEESGNVIIMGIAKLSTNISNATRPAVRLSALKKIRNILHFLYKSGECGTKALVQSIDFLTDLKQRNASHSITLGIISDVVHQVESLSAAFLIKKDVIIGFYSHEILGSRTPISSAVANGLYSFFRHFCSLQDLEANLFPTIEKSILRFPEIVLQGPLKSLFTALNPDIDLSQILARSLMKPILNLFRSPNLLIKRGAYDTMLSIVDRSHDRKVIEVLVTEILNVYPRNNPEQRVLYAQIISKSQRKPCITDYALERLLAIVEKETNENAAAAEITCVVTVLKNRICHHHYPDQRLRDAVSGALTTKNHVIQKLWARSLGDLILELPPDLVRRHEVMCFITQIIEELFHAATIIINSQTFTTLPTQIIVVHVLITLSVKLMPTTVDKALISKIENNILDESSYINSDRPFILSERVHIKLHDEKDLLWTFRASATCSRKILQNPIHAESKVKWGQLLIYYITKAGFYRNLQNTMVEILAETCKDEPINVLETLVQALWASVRMLDYDCDNPIVVNSGATRHSMALVIETMFGSMLNMELTALSPFNNVIYSKLIDVLVLCQRSLIPKCSWLKLCVKNNIDPGDLVKMESLKCMNAVINATNVSRLASILVSFPF